ncbi:MAG: prolyl oligopeptidase family serine peptidase [Inhella sp.]
MQYPSQRGALALAALAASLLTSTPIARANTGGGPAIQVPTTAQLAQFPKMSGFQISPDGKHMLAIESHGDTRNIVVWKLSDLSAKPTVIGAKNMQINSVSFLKNDMLQVMLMQPFDLRTDQLTKTFINKLLFTDLEGKNWIEPMASAEIARSDTAKLQEALAVPSVLNRMPGDPDHVILESDSRGETRDVYRYNVRKQTSTRILRLGEDDGEVRVNAQGQPWAKTRAGTDSKGAYIAIDFRNGNGWDEHFRSYVKDRDVINVVALGQKPGKAIISSNVGAEFSSLYEYDIESRKIGEKVFGHKYFDATGARSFNADGRPGEAGFDGYSYEGLSGNDMHWENPEIDSLIRGIGLALGLKETTYKLKTVSSGEVAEVRGFDGVVVRLLQRVNNEKGTNYLFRVSGPAYPAEYYLLQGKELKLLAKERPDIDKRALGSARFVYYKARDGLNIPAILTTPNEALCGPGPYPAVVHPHGGPWARDAFDYDGSGWVPMLVSQCRVVLQPQFRGSAGWGRTLWYAGDREWGQKMQDDKDDGAKWLVSEKLADPKRIAIFGFSYGGYAAFAASVRSDDVYKCAIAGAGVSDIERIWARFFTNPFFRQRQEHTVRGLNPLAKADQVKIPLMVYHGDRDQTVPLIQSELFVNKAKAAGKPVEYRVLADYAHGPAWTRKTMEDQLNIISDYLKKGCGGGL